MSHTISDLSHALRSVLTFPGLSHPRYAVVAPIVLDPEEPYLLIEVRASGISQAGDPCFPGGHIDPGETPAQAAARELYEELRISIPPERLLGQLPTVNTPLGARTNIFVCLLTPEEAAAAAASPEEVEVLLRVPLSFFLSRPEAGSYTVEGHTVWGMTAGAIRHLCRAWEKALTLL